MHDGLESETDVSNIGIADRSAVTVTQQVLKSLYKRGMTGWGKKLLTFLDLVAVKIGLTQPQIQVHLLDDCYLLVF